MMSRFSAGSLFVRPATKISREEVEPLGLGIAERHMGLNPAGETTVVFRAGAFAADVAKANLSAISSNSTNSKT